MIFILRPVVPLALLEAGELNEREEIGKDLAEATELEVETDGGSKKCGEHDITVPYGKVVRQLTHKKVLPGILVFFSVLAAWGAYMMFSLFSFIALSNCLSTSLLSCLLRLCTPWSLAQGASRASLRLDQQ